jgi:hypothetical protein
MSKWPQDLERSAKVASTGGMDDHDLLQELFHAIEEWETSPYYLPEEELFDLERFLTDQRAHKLKLELENIYGTPLNQKFWSSFLAYHRLKRAREEIKAQESLQDEKRRQYLEAMEEERKTWHKWVKEWFHHHRRQQIKVLPGGKKA